MRPAIGGRANLPVNALGIAVKDAMVLDEFGFMKLTANVLLANLDNADKASSEGAKEMLTNAGRFTVR
mgnify:CR=1 FL=1